MTNEQKIGLLELQPTKEYLEYIKACLKVDPELVDYTYYIPFLYDEKLLKQMCEEEGISMNYSSSYYVEGKYNPYMPLDKLVFTRKIK